MKNYDTFKNIFYPSQPAADLKYFFYPHKIKHVF